jgi:hypothetical protein
LPGQQSGLTQYRIADAETAPPCGVVLVVRVRHRVHRRAFLPGAKTEPPRLEGPVRSAVGVAVGPTRRAQQAGDFLLDGGDQVEGALVHTVGYLRGLQVVVGVEVGAQVGKAAHGGAVALWDRRTC